jgi:DNA-binding GntR family transcriptional regulator
MNTKKVISGVSEIVPIGERMTLGERVYRQLREMLIAGRFAPGEIVTLRTLASAIGTSLMPVRDALRQLMVDQAIELLPNRTFRVPIMNRERFTELRDIRVEVEGLLAERAARRITGSELQRVIHWSEEFAEECNAKKRNPSKLVLYNKNFHFAIYEAAHMPVLHQIVEGLWTQIGPVLNFDVRQGSERIERKIPCHHHSKLCTALQKGQPAAARKALVADITTAAEYILAQKQLPEGNP